MGLVLSAAAAAPLTSQRSWLRPPLPVRAVNAPLLPEVLLCGDEDVQLALSLAGEGVLRYVWHSRYGDMLIEVRSEEVFVNGQHVERHQG